MADNSVILNHGGIEVEVWNKGYGIAWLAVDAYDRSTAREVASTFGIVTEADVTEDGRFSFSVELNESYLQES